jgi:hypothetical protein
MLVLGLYAPACICHRYLEHPANRGGIDTHAASLSYLDAIAYQVYDDLSHAVLVGLHER